jgi:hypothetical protein
MQTVLTCVSCNSVGCGVFVGLWFNADDDVVDETEVSTAGVVTEAAAIEAASSSPRRLASAGNYNKQNLNNELGEMPLSLVVGLSSAVL